MDFGTGGVESWNVFVPEYGGNRELPPDQRLSLEIRFLRSIDQMAFAQQTEDGLFRWRKEHLKEWLEKDEYKDRILALGPDFLGTMKLLAEHTRAWQNFFFDGVEVTDPIELFIRLPLPKRESLLVQLLTLAETINDQEFRDADHAWAWAEKLQEQTREIINQEGQGKGLIEEVRGAIEATAGLTGDALKNLICSFAGSFSETSTIPKDEPTALDVPEDATPPASADISPAKETTV
jgi:hypothetical protein